MTALLAATDNHAPFAEPAALTPDLRFDSSNVSSSNVLPAEWAGKHVEVLNESATATELVAFRVTRGSATVTLGAAAAGGDRTAERGKVILPGERLKIKLPLLPALETAGASKALFFTRISAVGTPSISVSLVE